MERYSWWYIVLALVLGVIGFRAYPQGHAPFTVAIAVAFLLMGMAGFLTIWRERHEHPAPR